MYCSLTLQGRPFAFQECLLFLAALFYRFDVSLADPAYQLDVFQTITLNTRGLKIYTKRREGRSGVASSVPKSVMQLPTTVAPLKMLNIEEPVTDSSSSSESSDGTGRDSRRSSRSSIASSTVSVPLHVLYGSNSGTCEFLAKRVVSDARNHGNLYRSSTMVLIN